MFFINLLISISAMLRKYRPLRKGFITVPLCWFVRFHLCQIWRRPLEILLSLRRSPAWRLPDIYLYYTTLILFINIQNTTQVVGAEQCIPSPPVFNPIRTRGGESRTPWIYPTPPNTKIMLVLRGLSGLRKNLYFLSVL